MFLVTPDFLETSCLLVYHYDEAFTFSIFDDQRYVFVLKHRVRSTKTNSFPEISEMGH